MRRWPIATALTLLAGAALAQADAVTVIGDRSFLTECSHLGEVRGSSLVGILIENQGWENTVEEMKEKALALGGTHLLLHGVERGVLGSRGNGDVYNCPLQPEAPAPAQRRRRRG